VKLWGMVGRAWSWVFLLLLIAFFSLSAPGFFSIRNFQSVGVAASQNLIMALGQTFVIISAGIDLSVGYTMGLAAVVAALIMRDMQAAGITPWITLPVGMVAGILVSTTAGIVNGTIIARLKVPSFIVTLGMLGIARGFALILTGGPPVGGQPPAIGMLGNGYLLYYSPHAGVTFWDPPPLEAAQLRYMVGLLPHAITLAVVMVIICHLVLSKTLFGQHTYAVGGNLEAARRSGIDVDMHLIKVYAVSGLLAGVAGLLYVARFTSGSANAGEPLLLDSIAAVVIGGASLFGGEGTIIGTVIGALIIAVLQIGFVIQGVNPFWQFVAVGAVIIMAVLIDQARIHLVKR
jgi:predicted ABC-type sugar transport system permease subunit